MSSADLSRIAQSIFSSFDPEIWIVTSLAKDGRRGGLVATWVKVASIDPEAPSLVIGLDANHFTAELIRESGRFVGHLIRPDQLELVWRFAIGSGRDHDKLAGLSLVEGDIPILADCVAWLECRVSDAKTTGDRLYFWGEVVATRRISAEPALRESEAIRHATHEQISELKAAKSADIEIHRALRRTYREGLR